MIPQQQDPRIAQAQMAAQAQQGLGTPPQQEFEYKRNPSMDLMDAHVSKQQQELAAKMAQEQGQQGYAGYRAESEAPAVPVGGSNGQGQGWTPPSPEAHQMNVQLAERIKSGQLDPSTAMIAMQHPDVAPEIKQALSQMMQAQSVGQSEPQMAVASGSGLGQVAV